MTSKKSTGQFACVSRIAALALLLAVILYPVSTYADGDDNTTLKFLSTQETFSYGPPLPSNIEIQLAVSSNITETNTVDITLQAMNFTSATGQHVSVHEFIVDYREGGWSRTLTTPLTMQVVPFPINLEQDTKEEWGTYTGLLVAQIADKKPVAKSISLVIGPKEPPVILSPEIVVTAIGCPNFLNDIKSEDWKKQLAFLCPGHLKTKRGDLLFSIGLEFKSDLEQEVLSEKFRQTFKDHWISLSENVCIEEEGEGSQWRIDDKDQDHTYVVIVNDKTLNIYAVEAAFQVQIEGGGRGFVKLKGFDEKYLDTSGGAAVSKEGVGGIRLQLDKENYKKVYKACIEACSSCPCEFDDYRIQMGGSTNSGKYEGTLYLDTSDTEKDTAKVAVTILVRDQVRFPLIVIFGGVLMSLGINWYFGKWLKKKRKDKTESETKKSINKKIEQLRGELEKFLDPRAQYMKDKFYRTPPDVVYEAYALVDNEPSLGDAERLARLNSVIPLFQRFRDFFDRLYKVHEWHKTVKVDPAQECTDKMLEIGKGLRFAKRCLWTADTEQTMEKAQDVLIRTFLKVDVLFAQCNPNKDLPSMSRKVQKPQVPSNDEQDTLRKIWEWVLKTLKSLAHHIKKTWKSLLEALKSLACHIIALSTVFSIIKLGIVLLSGYYVLYLSNPTFGSTKDYVGAFLWGSTTAAAIKAVSWLLGQEESPIAALADLLKG